MRTTIRLDPTTTIRWSTLRKVDTFLFRRVADKQRAVLGIGLHQHVDVPRFDPSGRAVDWYFGHQAYSATPALKQQSTWHADGGMPAGHWWIPRWVVEWKDDAVMLHALHGDESGGVYFAKALLAQERAVGHPVLAHWERSTNKQRYLQQAGQLMQHIRRGDIYEVNYCTERHCSLPGLDPFAAFGSLLQRTQAPFAAFHRIGDRFALCASPERFLAFDGKRISGQPMKGTRPRSTNVQEDLRLAGELASDPKERSENIMALDVMRHDLSRIAASRSVIVEELCAVRSYPAVHQMVSTVAAVLREGLGPWDVVDAAFPMASMTGAPKIRAMQLIDELEDRPRGLYSGSLGFFAPDGTADLNVVIRTILYDALTGSASLSTGSALTATCDPEQEWAECELKASSVIDALGHA